MSCDGAVGVETRRVRFAEGPLREKYGTEDGHPDHEGKKAEPVRELEVQRPKLTKREVLMLAKELGEEYRESVDRLKRWVRLLPVRAPGRPHPEEGSMATDATAVNRDAFDCGPKHGAAQGVENSGDSTNVEDACDRKGRKGGFGKGRGRPVAAKRGSAETGTKSGNVVAGVDKKRRNQHPKRHNGLQ